MDSPATRSHQRWRTNPRLTLKFQQRGLAGSASNRRDAAFRYAGNSPALREVVFAPFRDRLELRDQSASLRGSGVSRLVRVNRARTRPAASRFENDLQPLPTGVRPQPRGSDRVRKNGRFEQALPLSINSRTNG